MKRTDKGWKRLDELIGALRDEQITTAEAEELREVLRTNHLAYRRLCEHLFLSSDLSAELAIMDRGSSSMGAKIHRRTGAPWASWMITGALAAGLTLLLVFMPRKHDLSDPNPADGQAAERVDYGVAVLTQNVGARWKADGTVMKQGSALKPGRIELLEGIARMEFYCGATVLLEGASELEIVSDWEAVLHRGKLRARVPYQARGFTIRSQQVKLVDRGTEFGMIAGEGAGTQVHVFKGTVELHDPADVASPAPAIDVREGAAMRIDSDLGRYRMVAVPEQFVSPEELDRTVASKSAERLHHWRAVSQALRDDPRVLAYYAFSRDLTDDRMLQCLGPRAAESMQGSIIGCSWSTGRWPDKDALEFKRPSDRVRITIPGTSKSLTIIAWVRIDGFDNAFNSLLLSDGWFRKGALHWQLTNSGIGELAVWPYDQLANKDSSPVNIWQPGPISPNYDSSQPLTAYDLGRWIHLAVVYDSEREIVFHLVDGQEIERSKLRAKIPISIGAAQIGNWDPERTSTNKPIRNFNGRMDELVVFGVALSTAEIRHHFESGKP